MFTATDQSLDGCLEVLRRAKRWRETISFDRPALLTVPVVSKFDAREEYKRAQQWRDKFASALPPFYSSWASKEVPLETLIARTTIPYAAYWSFGEELAVLLEPPQTTDSVRFYLETLAALIAQSLSNTELLVDAPERFIAAANRAGLTRAGYRYDIFLDGTQTCPNVPWQLLVDLRVTPHFPDEPRWFGMRFAPEPWKTGAFAQFVPCRQGKPDG